MMILSYFEEDGVPALLLTPDITIYDLSDNSVIIAAAAMTEVATGLYKYDFVAYSSDTDYGTFVDGGVALPDIDRYQAGSSATDNSASVWDIALAGHVTVGSTGAALNDIPTNVWNFGARTLTSMAGLACDLWACPSRTLTMALSNIRGAARGSDIDIDAGDWMSLSLTALGDITGRTKLWFTVKKSKEDVDASAWIQIEETDELIYISGTAAVTPANGTITIDNAARGDITVDLDGVETIKLTDAEGKGYFDIKWINAAGRQLTLRSGKCTIIADITRAVA